MLTNMSQKSLSQNYIASTTTGVESLSLTAPASSSSQRTAAGPSQLNEPDTEQQFRYTIADFEGSDDPDDPDDPNKPYDPKDFAKRYGDMVNADASPQPTRTPPAPSAVSGADPEGKGKEKEKEKEKGKEKQARGRDSSSNSPPKPGSKKPADKKQRLGGKK